MRGSRRSEWSSAFRHTSSIVARRGSIIGRVSVRRASRPPNTGPSVMTHKDDAFRREACPVSPVGVHLGRLIGSCVWGTHVIMVGCSSGSPESLDPGSRRCARSSRPEAYVRSTRIGRASTAGFLEPPASVSLIGRSPCRSCGLAQSAACPAAATCSTPRGRHLPRARGQQGSSPPPRPPDSGCFADRASWRSRLAVRSCARHRWAQATSAGRFRVEPGTSERHTRLSHKTGPQAPAKYPPTPVWSHNPAAFDPVRKLPRSYASRPACGDGLRLRTPSASPSCVTSCMNKLLPRR